MDKTEQALVYILRNHQDSSITSLMKLSYLIDYVNMRRYGKPITTFSYRRYKHGPFDSRIYQVTEALKEEEIIIDDTKWTSNGEEYIVYNYNDDCKSIDFSLLSDTDKNIINEVLETVNGLGAKALTKMTYNTPPMATLGATMGGSEHLNEKLNLSM